MLRIVTDSSANISQAEAKELGVTVLPLGITFDDQDYRDDIDISIDEFYTKLTSTKTFPKTSLPSMELLESTYEEAKKAKDQLIYITISSKLSGTNNVANLIKTNGNYDNVFVYDSKGATVVVRMLVEEALKHKNKSAEEVVEILNALRPKVILFAGVDTLEYLHKGGRLSKTKAILGTLMAVKPILTIEQDGGLNVVAKAKGGINNIIKTIKTLMEKDVIDTNYPVYFIYAKDKANGEKLQASFEDVNGKLLNLCSVIGCHTGPGLAGITYVAK